MGESEERELPKAPPLKRPHRHRAIHYAVLVLNVVIAVCCFVGSAALVVGQQELNQFQRTPPIARPSVTTGISLRPPDSALPDVTAAPGETLPATTGTSPSEDAPPETFPPADPNARNFLVTGSDNGACDDPNAPNQVGPRDELGERTDTIMVMRVDPSQNRAAILSFPRDLWVKIAGTNSNNRINAAYKVDEPQRLVDTIYNNFGIIVDHYIQIDFCAFKTLVDAVDGVAVPFAFQARDKKTNLNITQTGCVTLDGSTALAYVRSRYYEWLDPVTNKWKQDPTSDYGRISRQQDFMRRAVSKVISQGFDLGVARSLLDVAKKYVVVDYDLTIDKQLEFAGVLRALDPTQIHTYRVEGDGVVKNGAAVIVPRLKGANMQAILAIFQGHAQLESAPEQVFESTTTSVPRTTTTTGPTSTTDDSPTTRPPTGATTTTVAPTTTTTSSLPEVVVDQDTAGIVPPKDLFCP